MIVSEKIIEKGIKVRIDNSCVLKSSDEQKKAEARFWEIIENAVMTKKLSEVTRGQRNEKRCEVDTYTA